MDDIFWRAFRNPETFDADLPSLKIEGQTSECLLSKANEAFEAEQKQLLECGQILEGSPAWNDCHETAENLHNRGVVLSDIERSLNGTTRFDATQGGQFLIISKTTLGNVFWLEFVDLLQANTPALVCTYKCDEWWEL